MNVLDLFSGIGGFSLGLERAGMRTIAFCEIDPYCRAVLRRHWPTVPCYEDVRELSGQRLWDDGNTVSVQVICGGFPCQDISRAGNGAGITGARSGLWSEYRRLISDLRPQYVIVENVAALLERGIDVVCGDLAGLGYDAEWSIVSSCAFGAPHMRQRMFIVAYPNGEHGRPRVRDTDARPYWALQEIDGFEGSRARSQARMANPSELYGGADGIPFGMDRNRAIGNSVDPSISEIIGRAIMSCQHTSAQQAEKSACAQKAQIGAMAMPVNKAFDTQHRAMKALYETMERDQTWESPEQRLAASMVVHVLWSLARCKVPPKVLLEFLAENMEKLKAEWPDREAGG